MSITIQAILRSVYTKILFGGVIAFCGIVGGIYTGLGALKYNQPDNTVATYGKDFMKNTATDLTFYPGDLFPLENYIDTGGQIGNYEQLLGENPAVILFVSLDCGPCHELLEFWKRHMEERMHGDVRVIACIANDDRSIPPEYAALLNKIEVTFIDRIRWRNLYNLRNWPTIVGVDGSGFVSHIQYGFLGYFEHQLVSEFIISSP